MPSKVDLPEPELPVMASVLPFSSEKEISSKIRSWPLASSTTLFRPSTSRANMFFINQLLKLCLTLFMCTAAFQMANAQNTSNKTLLVIGDSLSAEYGIERGKGWVEIIKSDFLGDDDNYEVVNASIS